MSNVVLMNDGLDYATSAVDTGPLIAIKYFLPVYDYRIDPTLHNGEEYGTSAIDLSASALNTDTTPFGEIIYNIDESTTSYDFSETDNFVFLDGTESVTSATADWEVSGSIMSKEQYINLYEGKALFDCVSGSSVQYISASPTGGYWLVEDAVFVSGDNTIPTETNTGTNYFFPITDYYPVTDGSTVRGSWKCRLTKSIGNVKFNKIALYCVQIDGSGNEVGSPVLFAQAMLSSPVVKTNFANNGFDDIVLDVQVKIDSLTADFSEVFFSTSGDYWSRTPNGLYYAERIGIGTFSESLIAPQAKLDIKPSDDIAHIRMRNANTDSHFAEIEVLSATNDIQFSATSGDYVFKGDIYSDGLYADGSSLVLSANNIVVRGPASFQETVEFENTIGVTGSFSVLGTNAYLSADNNFCGDLTIVNESDFSKQGHIYTLSNGSLKLSADGDVIIGDQEFDTSVLRVRNLFSEPIIGSLYISAENVLDIDASTIKINGGFNNTTNGYPYLKYNGTDVVGIDIGTVANDVFGDRFNLFTGVTSNATATSFQLPSGFTASNTMVLSIQVEVITGDWASLYGDDLYNLDVEFGVNFIDVYHDKANFKNKNIKILLYKTS